MERTVYNAVHVYHINYSDIARL